MSGEHTTTTTTSSSLGWIWLEGARADVPPAVCGGVEVDEQKKKESRINRNKTKIANSLQKRCFIFRFVQGRNDPIFGMIKTASGFIVIQLHCNS